MKASIAKDLVEGQGEHSPTRELLKQYAPLEGIVAAPEGVNSRQSLPAEPVENGMARGATLAQDAESAWHDASLAPRATLAPCATPARYAMVKGELRVPNTISFSLFPMLEPYAKAVYYQLFVLSHGFRRSARSPFASASSEARRNGTRILSVSGLLIPSTLPPRAGSILVLISQPLTRLETM